MINNSTENDSVISGTTKCSTINARYICINNIYGKLYRCNVHDIGYCYTEDLVDHWFSFKVEIVEDIYLLHLFMSNNKKRDFRISLSVNSDILETKNDAVYLSQSLQNFDFIGVTENYQPFYVTTYHFTKFDVESFQDKKLYIHVKFTVIPSNNDSDNITNQVKLNHDYYDLLKDPINSDFTIESGDGHLFHVHQAILANQSEVFGAMLKEYTAEKQKAFVEMVDVTKEDLNSFLEFIYTGTISDFSACNLINVYMLADKYNLKDLMTLAEHAICESVTTDNIFEILDETDILESTYINQYLMKFIALHPDLLKSDLWKDVDSTDVLKELIKHLKYS